MLTIAAGSGLLASVENLPAADLCVEQYDLKSEPPSIRSEAPGSFLEDPFAGLPPSSQVWTGHDSVSAAPVGQRESGSRRMARSRRPRRRSRSAWPLVIGGVGLAGALTLGMAIGLFLIMTSRVTAHHFLPDDSTMVGTLELRELLASQALSRAIPGWFELHQVQEEIKRTTGLTADDIVRVTFAGDPSDRTGSFVAVVELRRAIDKESVIKSMPNRPAEEKVGSAVLYAGADRGDTGLHFANDRMVVVGSLPTLRTVLQRNRKAEFPADLREAVGELDPSQTLSVAIRGGKALQPPGGGIPFAADMFSGIEAVVVNVKAAAAVQLSATAICKEAAVAENLAKIINGGVAMLDQFPNAPPEAKEMLRSLKISHFGRKLTVQITFSERMLATMPRLPGPGGIPGPKFSF